MKRVLGHVIAASGFATLGGILGTACAHNDQSVFIRGIMAPPQVQVGTTCTFTADPTLPMLSAGLLDSSFTASYTAVLLIGNQLVAQGNSDQVRTESSRIVIQGAVVRVTDAGNNEVRSFTRLASGFADPASGSAPNYGLVNVEILDSQSISAAAGGLTVGSTETKRRVAHVKVFGKTLGGESVESNEFDFPIDICNGCLVSFPAGSQNDQEAIATGKPNCHGTLGGTTSGAQIFQPCFQGQDQLIDCRICQSNAACDPSLRSTAGGG